MIFCLSEKNGGHLFGAVVRCAWSNWRTGALPGSADDAVINPASSIAVVHASGADSIHSLTSQNPLTLSGGSLAIAADSSVSNTFTFSGGTLSGTGALTLTSQVTWTGGLMSGSGTTSIAAGGSLTLAGGDKDLSGWTLSNAGIATWSSGRIRTGSAARLVNTGTWDITNNSVINRDHGGAVSSFTNLGTLRKSAGNGATTIDIPFTSDGGALNIVSGTLTISGAFNTTGNGNTVLAGNIAASGGGTLAGTLDVAAGAMLNFAGGFPSISSSAILTGQGLYALNGATLTVDGTLTAAGFTMNSGTLAGQGTVTATNTFTWTGGLMIGPGTTRVDQRAIATLSGGADKDISERRFENFGSLTWTAGRIRTGNAAVLSNSGTWDAQTSNVFNRDHGGNISSFVNSGSFKKSVAAGTTTIDIPFTSSGGTLDVQAGTLNISGAFNTTGNGNSVQAGTVTASGGGTLAGTLDVAAGAMLNFAGGFPSISSSAILTGQGLYALNGSTLTMDGTLTADALTMNSEQRHACRPGHGDGVEHLHLDRRPHER